MDGGVVDTLPTEAIISLCETLCVKYDKIIVIHNSKPGISPLAENPTDIVGRLKRVIEIMLAEITQNDIGVLTQANYIAQLEERASKSVKVSLVENKPKSLRNPVDIVHIYPERDLGDPLNFDPKEMKDIWLYGFDRAIEIWESQ